MRAPVAALLATLFTWAPSAGAADNLDTLLEQVRAQSARELAEYRAREQRFLEARDNQAALVEEARAALAAQQRRGEALNTRFQDNEEQIVDQRLRLAEQAGELAELADVARESASVVAASLRESLVSAQHPGRDTALTALATGGELPTLADLEQAWMAMLEEMNESGKVVRFEAPVISGDGREQRREVTRVGVFTALSEGRYLRHLPETGHLVELARQPPARERALASALESATGDVANAPVDPTRGAILALLVHRPGLVERVRQGRLVGYVILALGALALLIALERFLSLTLTQRRVRRQLGDEEAREDNPLGRILRVYRDNPSSDAETLGLKLDEAILKELPAVQRGLTTLAIIAGVAPLLGLLGTVTGMIQTFQSITLFGTGDPRLMSGGISQALVTTELGLVVAIPVLMLHSLLSSKSNRLVQVLDEQSAAAVARAAEGADRGA